MVWISSGMTKKALQKAQTLGYLNNTDPYTLTTDAPLIGIVGRNYFPKITMGETVLHTQAKRSAIVNEIVLRQNEIFL